MSKLSKILSAIAVMVIGLTTLVGCNYNFYKDWSEAGATIEKTNVFEAITLDEAKSKIEASESFVLVVGCSQSAVAVGQVTTIQTLADYYEYDGKLQFVDATEYIATKTVRDELKNALGIKEPIMSTNSSNLIFVIYEEGKIKLDSSLMKYNYQSGVEYFDEFHTSGVINVNAIASYLFVDYKAE